MTTTTATKTETKLPDFELTQPVCIDTLNELLNSNEIDNYTNETYDARKECIKLLKWAKQNKKENNIAYLPVYHKYDKCGRYICGKKGEKFIKAPCYTNLKREIRHHLCKNLEKKNLYVYDFDMVKSLPNIMLNLCEKLDIPESSYCCLKQFCENPKKYVEQITKDEQDENAKLLFNQVWFGKENIDAFCNTHNLNKTLFAKQYKDESDTLTNLFKTYKDRPYIKYALQNADANQNPKAWVSTLYFYIESIIFLDLKDYLSENYHERFSLSSYEFDGFHITTETELTKDEFENLISELSACSKNLGFRTKWKVKEFETINLTPRELEKNIPSLVWEDIVEFAFEKRMFRMNNSIYQRDATYLYKADKLYDYMCLTQFIDAWRKERHPNSPIVNMYHNKIAICNTNIKQRLELDEEKFPIYTPTKETNLRYFGYTDGVYDIMEDKFIATDAVPKEVVCRNFFPHNFPNLDEKSTIELLETNHESLLKTFRDQNFTDETIEFLCAMVGRCLFPINNPVELNNSRKKNHMIVLFLYGQSNTGKSTLTELLREIVGIENTFTITKDKHLAQLHGIHDAHLIYCDDNLPSDIRSVIDEQMFKNLCDGEVIKTRGVGDGYKDGGRKTNTPIVFALNYNFNYPPNEQIRRRVVRIKYLNKINEANKDHKIYDQTISQAHSFAPLFVKAYHKIFKSEISNIWELLTNYQQISSWRMDSETDEGSAVQDFLTQRVVEKANKFITHKEFLNNFHSFLNHHPIHKYATREQKDKLNDWDWFQATIKAQFPEVECYGGSNIWLCGHSVRPQKQKNELIIPHPHKFNKKDTNLCCCEHSQSHHNNNTARVKQKLIKGLSIKDDWDE